jgi:CheY-like chemotaxis protein
VRASPEPAFLCTRAGRVVWSNEAAQLATGLSREELGETPLADFLTWSPRDDGEAALLARAIEAGEFIRCSANLRVRGGAHRAYRASIAPVRPPDASEPQFLVRLEVDAVDTLADAQHRLAREIEGLAALANGIAHHLNNALSPLLIASDLLLRSPLDSDQRAWVAEIEASGERARQLVAEIFRLHAPSKVGFVPLELHRLLEGLPESEVLLASAAPDRLVLRIAGAAPGLRLLGDVKQLSAGLCFLALDVAESGSGPAEVAVTCARSVRPAAEGSTQAWAVIEITRTSVEVEDPPARALRALAPRVAFDLAAAHRILTAHGGRLSVQASSRGGPVYRVELPLAEEDLHAVAPAPLPRLRPSDFAALPTGLGPGVLVVDDDESIQASLARSLPRFGYRVLSARHGGEAIEIIRAQRAEISVVLTDISMPEVDGYQLIASLEALAPDLPVVVATGLAATDGVERLRLTHARSFVAKPFHIQTLLSVLAAAVLPETSGDASADSGEAPGE